MNRVLKNRARTFIASLEVLRDSASEMIEHIKQEDLETYDETKLEEYRSEQGSLDDALLVLDDALDSLPCERNGYAAEAELETEELIVQFKERKG